jgi:hypothetical protein
VPLSEDLGRIAAAAAEFAGEGESLTGVVAAEPSPGMRVYLCAFQRDSDALSWLALDEDGAAVRDRALVRDAVSIAALCELAEDFAAGGDLDELRARLVALRLTENPIGIEEAEEATRALQLTIGAAPRLASPKQLDAVGSATRRLEQALGEGPGSPFAEAMKQGVAAVDELTKDVEAGYKIEFE